MPSLKMAVPHNLSQEEATNRLKGFFEKVKARFQGQVKDLEEKWDGSKLNFGFTTYGINVKGDLDVAPSEVKIDGQIPFAAIMFKGKIEQAIRDELGKVLS